MTRSKGRKNIPMDEVIDKYVNQMYFITELAKEYDVTYTTMKNKLVKVGVQIRDKKEEKKRAMNREETKQRVSEGSKRSAPQRKQTNLERYGHETAMNGPEKKEEWQKEHEKKYGVKWGTQRQDTIEKRKQRLLNEHGVDNVAKIPEVAKKISENRWQNKSEEELIEIIEKMQDLSPESKERHREGIKKNRWENKTQEELDEIWDKTIQTWIQNYDGYDNPNKRPEARKHMSYLRKKYFIEQDLPRLLDYWGLELLDEFNGSRQIYNWRCKKCGNTFTKAWNEVQQGYKCEVCYPRNIPIKKSKGEIELEEFLKNELNITNILSRNSTIIPPKEIDIYLPDYNFAIEFNGLYWHSEENKHGKDYHLEKTTKCEEKGIRLIHIFEDEWVLKKEVIKSKLAQILNIDFNKRKINTRECEIKEISADARDNFLNNYHLQYTDYVSIIRLGAFYNDELVSVMTFTKGGKFRGNSSELENPKFFELSRFCIKHDCHISGIANKFLSYFKNNYDWERIETYSDKRWSNGNLYLKLGFNHIKDTDPNYWFIISGKRHHRLIELKELTDLERSKRIWDCGHKLFEIRNK